MKKNLDEKAQDKVVQPAVRDSIPALVEFVRIHAYESSLEDAKIEALKHGVEEVLENILEFACPEGNQEITISCESVDSGAMLFHIWDTGKPFNMLLAGIFPEVEAISKHEKIPSTKLLKKAVKNIEYIRGTDKNILILTLPPIKGKI